VVNRDPVVAENISELARRTSQLFQKATSAPVAEGAMPSVARKRQRVYDTGFPDIPSPLRDPFGRGPLMSLASFAASLRRAAGFAVLVVPLAAAPAVAQAAVDYTPADIEFMQGMIHHHAQALVMAAMAPSHGASERLLLFCKKVTLSQHDEIVSMQRWLRDRGLAAPDPSDPHFGDMPGMPGMKMMMPGMLTDAQLKALDEARDTTFDRLFLTDMIQHHRGALTMVNTLFDHPGSGQQADLFRFATDVTTDQTAEINRMQQMLNSSQESKTP
jgi:uncharacterized protein (DUF305 family)